jgi:UDP-3-O-[3-hydroxymyristoyl] glucosamine N-acyltransferase
VVPRDFSEPAATELIFSDNPRLAFARIMQYFHPQKPPFSGLSAMAAIGNGFVCGRDTAVAPLAFIGQGVVLGDRVVIHPHVCIGDGVRIGDDTRIMPNVSILDNCVIGSRVIIGAGTVIGADGFGYTPDENGRQIKIPQTGIVEIDDDVELGAANTIDRATFGRTWIQQGVKTDNHVHVGHNVTIGENAIIVALVGIAGSTTVGRNVIVAGQAGIGGHLTIGDNAVIGPQAGVARNVGPGKIVSGTPEMPHGQWLRVQQIVGRLPEMKKQVADLRRRMTRLEKDRLQAEARHDNMKETGSETEHDTSDSNH